MTRTQIVIDGNPGIILARVAPLLSKWLGENGCVLGGGRPAELMARMPPMPIEWFDHENAHRRVACADPERYLETLSADHLAGFEPRPNGKTRCRPLVSESANREEMT